MALRDRGSAPDNWVLVTDDLSGQSRSALAAVRALAAAGFRPVVTTCGPRSVAAASRYCVRRVDVPRAGTPGYPDALRREVERGRYVCVLVSSDAALLSLDAPEARLLDKSVLAQRAQAVGLSTVPGQVFASLPQLREHMGEELARGRVKWVVKPLLKSELEALPARMVSSIDDLRGLGGTVGQLIVQPFVEGGLRAVSGVLWEGRLLAASHQRYHRIWPRHAGVGCSASTVEPDLALEKSLVCLLEGHSGVFQVQLIGNQVLDVNPRVFGSLPLAVAAGANLPAVAADAARGRVGALVRARPGVRYRWLEGDLRNLMQAAWAGELSAVDAIRQLRPRRGTAHSIESVRDPGPMLARVAPLTRRVVGR